MLGPFYKDVETGWYYLNSRYYNPEIGRFINADSRLNPSILGKNMYANTENNPVNYIDPYGTFSYAATLFAASCFEVEAYTSLFPVAGQVIFAGLIVVGVTGAILIELNEQDALPPLLQAAPESTPATPPNPKLPNKDPNKDKETPDYIRDNRVPTD